MVCPQPSQLGRMKPAPCELPYDLNRPNLLPTTYHLYLLRKYEGTYNVALVGDRKNSLEGPTVFRMSLRIPRSPCRFTVTSLAIDRYPEPKPFHGIHFLHMVGTFQPHTSLDIVSLAVCRRIYLLEGPIGQRGPLASRWGPRSGPPLATPLHVTPTATAEYLRLSKVKQ